MDEKDVKKLVIDTIKEYNKSQVFIDRKTVDTPTDAYSIVNRNYIDNLEAGALNASSASDGQVLAADGAGGVVFEYPTILGSFTAYEDISAGDAVCLIAPDTQDEAHSESNQDADEPIGDAAARTYVAQGFRVDTDTYINKLDLYLKTNNSPTGNLTVHIYSNNGGAPGSSLGSGTITGSDITASYAYHTVSFDDPILLATGTYHIVITRTAAVDASNYFIVGMHTVAAPDTGYPSDDQTNTAFAVREGDATPAWTLIGAATKYNDLIFRTYREDTTATAQIRPTKGTSDLRTYNFIGFANAAITSGSAGVITRLPNKGSLSSLTPGRLHYISNTAGAIGTGAGTYVVEVGVGASTTSLELYNRKSVTAAMTKLAIVPKAVSVSNTASETNLISFTLNAGELSTNNMALVKLLISNLQSNSANTITFKCYYGATSINFTAYDIANVDGEGYIEFLIAADGATNDQQLTAQLHTTRGAQFTNAAHDDLKETVTGAAAIDSTVDQTVRITATWSGADATDNITVAAGYAYIVK